MRLPADRSSRVKFRDVVPRRARALGRLRPDGDRRRLPRGQRARDALRRRARLGRARARDRRLRHRAHGLDAYLAVALAGTIGYLVGSIGGWAIGVYGGRPFLERRGRWLHLDARPARPRRALVRPLGGLGRLRSGRLTPVVALVHLDPRRRLRGAASCRYTVLTALGIARSGASRSPASAGRSARAGRASTTRSATSRYASWRSSSWPSSRTCRAPPPLVYHGPRAYRFPTLTSRRSTRR